MSLEAVSLEACLRRVTLKSNSSIFKHLSQACNRLPPVRQRAWSRSTVGIAACTKHQPAGATVEQPFGLGLSQTGRTMSPALTPAVESRARRQVLRGNIVEASCLLFTLLLLLLHKPSSSSSSSSSAVAYN